MKTKSILLFALCTLHFSFFISPSFAQNTWTNLNPTLNAGNRDSHNMVWDTESQRAILYGGHYGGNPIPYSETWAYDYSANTWTNMSPAINPGNRAEYGMCYMPQHDRVILYGGGTDNNTWSYDFNTNTWTNLNPAQNPGSLGIVTRMAYDAESDRIILYNHNADETWAYDYVANTWQNMNPPLPRPASNWQFFSAIEYDSSHDRIVIATPAQQTWEYSYNTNTWQQRVAAPNVLLSGGGIYDMDYDAANDKMILYGDNQITWAYDYNSDSWTNMNASPNPTAHHHAICYMPQFCKMLFYGGYNYTWEYAYATCLTGISSEQDKEDFDIEIYPRSEERRVGKECRL